MKRAITTGFIVLTLIFLICLVSIQRFGEEQQEQSLQHWQTTLSALADNQSLNVSRWIFTNKAPLKEISSNGSVQLYLQRVTEKSGQEREQVAQIDYLRNLIVAAAQREGYQDKQRSQVNANLQVIANSSLSIYDKHLVKIASTAGTTLPSPELERAVLLAKESGSITTSKIWLNANQVPQIGFVAPIKGLSNLGADNQIIGFLIGVKNAEKELFTLLKNFSVDLQSLESSLLQATESGITYASTLRQDNSSPLSKTVASNSQTVAAIGYKESGSFIEALDYRNVEALAISRNIADSDLKLILKVDRSEAIGPSLKKQEELQTILVLGAVALLAMLIAAGWYGNLIRAQRSNEELRSTTDELEEKTHLLDAINNNVADMVMIIDEQQQLAFINRALADKVSTSIEDSKGKSINAVMGSHYAEQLEPVISQCFRDKTEMSEKKVLSLKGQELTFMISLTPMLYGYKESVMLHFHDITLLEAHQQQQTKLLRQIMQSLMHAIDLHDPYTANHSQKAASVALAVAEALELAEQDIETVEIAANLCNLGKLSIPKELLTKTESLTDEERQIVQNEANYAHEILKDIDFEGPVLETIIYKNEYLDGSGRKGIVADQIQIHARILTAVNDFVAMISPRAYRDSLPVEVALDQLLQSSDSKYDRQVIASLFHVVENKLDLD
ncbi:HD domain-containing phosphohydrolase [Neptuniibacter caesariensis]|uniref:Metal-dependent phosphohydrolase, HD subdomain n=1 Tax=Neptuniibacter caesariensis TaxID=207954 RepID=A0A7U8C8R9_NEPCE|nr:HD domain-containing phosphohydrolase [Neptuniibacter caesariensis]EAR62229.1 Metal-dependent phosphohydrolase, HD subdomain [Oceanospirillum sp. MED92] [Neptuniibacter caesariensis]